MANGYFTQPRETQLWCDLPNTVLQRKGWTITKTAREIRQQRTIYKQFFGGIFNAGQVLFTGDAWIMQPFGMDPTELLTTDAGAVFVSGSDVNLATNHRVFESFRKTTVPGAGQAGNVISSGAPAFQRRRAAGADLDTGNLDADATAYPSPVPVPDPPLIPADRVMAGTVTYPANQPFILNFQTVSGSHDILARFMFGGATEVLPNGQDGGAFCLELRSDGRGVLSEYDAGVADWVPVWETNWEPSRRAGMPSGILENQMVFLVPYGRNRLFLFNLAAGISGGPGFTLLGILTDIASVAIESKLPPPRMLFRHGGAKDDHVHLKHLTGPGVIRLDKARTDRLPFRIAHPHYRTSGFIIDAPIYFDVGVIPLASHLTLTTHGYAPTGTSLVPTVYDADTGVALLRSGNYWLTNAGQNRYFVGCELRSDGDPDSTPPVATGEQTPVYEGYTIELLPAFTAIAATPTKTNWVRDVNVTGPGVAAIEENASLTIDDPTDGVAILRVRDQMRSKIVLCYRGTSTPISVLFEGQTASPEATLTGTEGLIYPAPTRHSYDLRMTGLWPRLFRQIHLAPPFSFASSQDSPHPLQNAAGIWLPWRLTDTLRWAFNAAGVPDSQLDIPDNPFRWPESAELKPEDFCIMPGTPYARLIEMIPKDFLGQIVVRDPNCGLADSTGLPTGMWRLLANPALNSTNYLFEIDLDAPPAKAGAYIPMKEGAYGSSGIFPVRAETWKTHPKAAECNVCICRGFADGNSSDGPQMLQSVPLINPAGFGAASPDYLEGDTVIVLKVFEGFGMNLASLKWANRVLYQRAAFAEKWWQCVIPLPLVTDPTDAQQVLPRAPRINDLLQIKYGGVLYPAVIRSANPIWGREGGGDDYPWCFCEGKFIDRAFTIAAA